MRQFIIGVLGALAVSTAANAADLPVKARPMPAPAVYNWTGFYAGIFGGGGWGHHNRSNTAGFNNSYDSSGGLVGGFVGYNWQLNNPIVVGLEGDLAWASISGDDGGAGGTIDKSEYRWLGSVRARAGYAVNNWLFFATGGWAFANIRHTNSSGTLIVTTDTFDNTLSGWTVGGGIEYALLPNWTIRGDYRYYDFGSYSRNAPPNGITPYSVSNTLQTATVGIAYKF